LKAKHEKLISAISKLLDSAKGIEGDREMKLNAIIDNYVPQHDYRDYLVKNQDELSICSHKRICLSEEGSHLYLLHKTRVRGENYKKIEIDMAQVK
jgi:hypothetical protein